TKINTTVGGDKFIATSWILFQSAQALYGGESGMGNRNGGVFRCCCCFADSPFAIRHSPFAIRHSPFAIRHSPFAIRPVATAPCTGSQRLCSLFSSVRVACIAHR
ncbi:hypothetical protein IXO621_19635, partial [Xanthomonas oryzae pv. oryzae]